MIFIVIVLDLFIVNLMGIFGCVDLMCSFVFLLSVIFILFMLFLVFVLIRFVVDCVCIFMLGLKNFCVSVVVVISGFSGVNMFSVMLVVVIFVVVVRLYDGVDLLLVMFFFCEGVLYECFVCLIRYLFCVMLVGIRIICVVVYVFLD